MDSDLYGTVDAFEADFDLMIQNAITFNGLDSEVGQMAVGLADRFKILMSTWRSGNAKKRKDGDKPSGQPSKKVKLG